MKQVEVRKELARARAGLYRFLGGLYIMEVDEETLANMNIHFFATKGTYNRLEEFGIPKEQAILSATLIPAREIGREKEIGSIESGKLADFVVCDEDLRFAMVFMGGWKADL